MGATSPSTQAAGSGLTAAQRLFFEAQGYLVVPDVLTGDELARVRRAAGEAERRWRADPSLPGVRRHDLEQVLGIMEYDPVLFELLEQPRIFPLVRELLGPDLMMLDHDYFMTPPGAEIPWGWHHDFDLPGVFHSRSRLMVKVFYVLEDVPDDGGATLVLPGSHRFPPGLDPGNAELPEELPGAVKMALPAGSAYLITARTYHSAGTNRSDRYRHLLIYTYGHKWMRMWDEYRPSAALAARATTPMRRQLLGLTDPYGPAVGEGAEE
jgi:ectoine hydroxylase-related dioxygenase (phytanoyl-CoA dioxygenase family)